MIVSAEKLPKETMFQELSITLPFVIAGIPTVPSNACALCLTKEK